MFRTCRYKEWQSGRGHRCLVTDTFTCYYIFSHNRVINLNLQHLLFSSGSFVFWRCNLSLWAILVWSFIKLLLCWSVVIGNCSEWGVSGGAESCCWLVTFLCSYDSTSISPSLWLCIKDLLSTCGLASWSNPFTGVWSDWSGVLGGLSVENVV